MADITASEALSLSESSDIFNREVVDLSNLIRETARTGKRHLVLAIRYDPKTYLMSNWFQVRGFRLDAVSSRDETNTQNLMITW